MCSSVQFSSIFYFKYRIGSFVSPAEVLVCFVSFLFKSYLYSACEDADVVCDVSIEVLFGTDVKMTVCETVDTLCCTDPHGPLACILNAQKRHVQYVYK